MITAWAVPNDVQEGDLPPGGQPTDERTSCRSAMATPRPGYLSNRGLQALRVADGRILFAHADLSGYSVFEEAAWWGYEAARRLLRS